MFSTSTTLVIMAAAASALAGPTGNTTASNTANTITAHPDGQCRQTLNGTARNTFVVDHGQDFPQYTTVQQPRFPGAETKNGSGWDVWWHIPQPAPGCRFLLMLPYRQSSGTPGLPAGNEIINAGREGCYFGNIPTSSDVYLSYCCGADQCTRASLNSTSLLSTPQRRDTAARAVQATREIPEQLSRATIPVVAELDASNGAARGGSSAAKASALMSRYWYEAPAAPPPAPDCKVVKPGQPYSRAGKQVVVSSSQACTQGPCLVSLSFQITSSTTATSSKDTTITTEFGRATTVTGGDDFLGGASAELRTSLSRAVSESTGQDLMSGNASTITTTVALKLGNRGVVTFTPVLRCITGPLDCGNGLSDPIDFCQPDLSGPGGSPLGDYYPLISD